MCRRLFAVLIGTFVLMSAGCSSPSFDFDVSAPFYVEFGRGSGWRGLAMVIVDEVGQVQVSQDLLRTDGKWRTATIQLSPSGIAELAAAIRERQLTALSKTYSKNINDGTQWGLYLRQGKNEKVVYFDNSFPSAIKKFAEDVDGVLKRGGLDGAKWQDGGREMDADLWRHIEGKP